MNKLLSAFHQGKRLIAGLTFLLSALCLPVSGQAGENTITNALGMAFIRVNPGSFTMGSPAMERLRDNDEVVHDVTISTAFYLQETEVTLAQWHAVMGKGWLSRKQGADNMPVTRVSWYDCIQFIKKLNTLGHGTFRLPTEAEWEYACRAGTVTAYAWGEGIDCAKAVYANNPNKDGECVQFFQTLGIPPAGPAPVKTFAPNAWGFYDMHGNVWEWCQDLYIKDLSPAGAANARTHSESRVRRGGSWYKHAQYLRSANRTYAHPGAKFKTTGFRLVLEAD